MLGNYSRLLLYKLPVSCVARLFCFFFFRPSHAARGILVPWPGIEPRPLAVKARSPNHWTAREFPCGRSFVANKWKVKLNVIAIIHNLSTLDFEIWEMPWFDQMHANSNPEEEPFEVNVQNYYHFRCFMNLKFFYYHFRCFMNLKFFTTILGASWT